MKLSENLFLIVRNVSLLISSYPLVLSVFLPHVPFHFTRGPRRREAKLSPILHSVPSGDPNEEKRSWGLKLGMKNVSKDDKKNRAKELIYRNYPSIHPCGALRASGTGILLRSVGYACLG